MTVLVDYQIKELIESNMILVNPYDPVYVNPNSMDLTLSSSLIFAKQAAPGHTRIVDPLIKDTIDEAYNQSVFQHSFIFAPGDFILCSTIESIELPPNICAEVNGKSSIARLGITIHQTGGWIDCGFGGTITLELHNSSPHFIILRYGMPICQLVFHLTEPAETPYCDRPTSKYNNQCGPVASRYYETPRTSRMGD